MKVTPKANRVGCYFQLGAQRRGILHRSAYLDGDCFALLAMTGIHPIARRLLDRCMLPATFHHYFSAIHRDRCGVSDGLELQKPLPGANFGALVRTPDGHGAQAIIAAAEAAPDVLPR